MNMYKIIGLSLNIFKLKELLTSKHSNSRSVGLLKQAKVPLWQTYYNLNLLIYFIYLSLARVNPRVLPTNPKSNRFSSGSEK